MGKRSLAFATLAMALLAIGAFVAPASIAGRDLLWLGQAGGIAGVIVFGLLWGGRAMAARDSDAPPSKVEPSYVAQPGWSATDGGQGSPK